MIDSVPAVCRSKKHSANFSHPRGYWDPKPSDLDGSQGYMNSGFRRSRLYKMAIEGNAI